MEGEGAFTGCPTCRSTDAEARFDAPLGIELGGGASTGRFYPYFDRGLMCQIDSAKHRQQVCKARGLVPVDGDIDLDDDHRKQSVEEAETKRKYAELQDMYDHRPDFADHRRLRDLGYYEDLKRRSRQGA